MVRPVFEHFLEVRQLEEKVIGFFFHRSGAGDGGFRVDEFRRGIGRAAGFTVVAVLVFSLTFRTGAFDETVRQEHFFFRVVELFDGLAGNVAFVVQLIVNVAGEMLVFRRIGTVIMVELDVEPGEVGLVLFRNTSNQFFRCDAFGLSA